ncbi:MAG: glutathione S-transferase family protein [Sphingobium sp.]
MELYYHPLSSYCWKVLIALYENGTAFTPRMLEEPGVAEEWARLWPIARFPILRDGDAVIAETSVIIEYLGLKAPGPFVPIPPDPDAAIEARLMDRLLDNYVMTPLQAVVFEAVRPADANRDPHGVTQAKAMLAKAYAMIETRMTGRSFAAGETMTLADCAAVPALFYADYILPFRATHPTLAAYMARMEQRPSVARVLAEKEPWFHNFPFAKGPPADAGPPD